MSNGEMREAEIDAILSGGQREVNAFLVKTVIELKKGMYEQRTVCEERALVCPALLAKRRAGDARDADYTEQRTNEQAKQVWLMWMIGSKVGYIVTFVIGGVVMGLVSWLMWGKP